MNCESELKTYTRCVMVKVVNLPPTFKDNKHRNGIASIALIASIYQHINLSHLQLELRVVGSARFDQVTRYCKWDVKVIFFSAISVR